MIHVDRSKVSPPKQLAELEKEFLSRGREYMDLSSEKRRERKFPWHPYIPKLQQNTEIIEALATLFQAKCAYCETKVDVNPGRFIDHFRPTARALSLDGMICHEHYWWLALDWSNLYLVCADCTMAKANRFPIDAAERCPVMATGADLKAEKPLLLDPCEDKPWKHLEFADDGKVRGSTKRGQITIEVLALNRSRLQMARRERIDYLRKTWHEWIYLNDADASPAERNQHEAMLRGLVASHAIYAEMARQLLARWIDEQEGPRVELAEWLLDRYTIQPPVYSKSLDRPSSDDYSLATKDADEKYYAKARFIERVRIENFKSVEEMDVAMHPGEVSGGSGEEGAARAPWKVLLGENGTAKSTLLEAIALAVVGEEVIAEIAGKPGVDLRKFIRWEQESARVEVWLLGVDEPLVLELTREKPFWRLSSPEPKVLTLAYGSTRLLPRGEAKSHDTHEWARVENLFDPFRALGDAEQFLERLSDAEFAAARGALARLLRLEEGARIDRDEEGVYLLRDNTRQDFYQISDGYQTIIALACDIMEVALHRWSDFASAEAIILIDELGVHLHPRWQMRIVESLRETFPRMQFVATTHQPLCLRGLRRGEVTVMERTGTDAEEGPHVRAVTEGLPAVDALRVDQLLTSPHFGLESAYDPEVDELLSHYYQLLAKPAPTDKEAAQIAELRARLDDRRLLGDTQREQLLLQVIDEYLAQRRAEGRPQLVLPEETKKQFVDMWRQIPLDDGPADA